MKSGVMKRHHMSVVMEYTPLIQQFARTLHFGRTNIAQNPGTDAMEQIQDNVDILSSRVQTAVTELNLCLRLDTVGKG